jgi:hypothetical protein
MLQRSKTGPSLLDHAKHCVDHFVAQAEKKLPNYNVSFLLMNFDEDPVKALKVWTPSDLDRTCTAPVPQTSGTVVQTGCINSTGSNALVAIRKCETRAANWGKEKIKD